MGRLKKSERLTKIVSIEMSESELSVKMGKLVEKEKAKFVYYCNDKRHYEVYDGEEKKLK